MQFPPGERLSVSGDRQGPCRNQQELEATQDRRCDRAARACLSRARTRPMPALSQPGDLSSATLSARGRRALIAAQCEALRRYGRRERGEGRRALPSVPKQATPCGRGTPSSPPTPRSTTGSHPHQAGALPHLRDGVHDPRGDCPTRSTGTRSIPITMSACSRARRDGVSDRRRRRSQDRRGG